MESILGHEFIYQCKVFKGKCYTKGCGHRGPHRKGIGCKEINMFHCGRKSKQEFKSECVIIGCG